MESKRWRAMAWVTTAVVAGSLYEAGVVATHHLATEGWPAHARFHALVGGLYLAALCVCALLLAWGPLRSGTRMARLAFAFSMLAIPGLALAASLVVPGGEPPLPDRVVAGVGLVIGVVLAIGVAFPGGARRDDGQQ